MSDRVVAYIRVSSDKQTVENQRPEIEALAKRRGWTVVEWYEEQESAVKRRPQFDRLLADAQRSKFTHVVIWRLDRFGRTIGGNMADARKLDRAGVSLVSVGETWLDTTDDSLLREFLIAVFSYVAANERRTLIERTNAGLRRARAEGVTLGRGRVPDSALAAVHAIVTTGRGERVKVACARTTYLTRAGKERTVSESSYWRWLSKRVGAPPGLGGAPTGS
jgi:DNA invertase Pin-like site-specific DNA recombinase